VETFFSAAEAEEAWRVVEANPLPNFPSLHYPVDLLRLIIPLLLDFQDRPGKVGGICLGPGLQPVFSSSASLFQGAGRSPAQASFQKVLKKHSRRHTKPSQSPQFTTGGSKSTNGSQTSAHDVVLPVCGGG
jgi:hypothetical protein